jgi:hypothetical protein
MEPAHGSDDVGAKKRVPSAGDDDEQTGEHEKQRPVDLRVDAPALHPSGQQQETAYDDRRLGRHDARKKQSDHDQGGQYRADHQHAIGIDLRRRRFQSRGAAEFGAMEERDERHGRPISATGPNAKANVV